MVTLTFAEEKLGLAYADLSSRWSDLHLDGGWVKRRRQHNTYVSLWFHQDTVTKHSRLRLKIQLLCLLKRAAIFHAYPPWMKPSDEIFMLTRVQHLLVQMGYESTFSTRSLLKSHVVLRLPCSGCIGQTQHSKASFTLGWCYNREITAEVLSSDCWPSCLPETQHQASPLPQVVEQGYSAGLDIDSFALSQRSEIMASLALWFTHKMLYLLPHTHTHTYAHFKVLAVNESCTCDPVTINCLTLSKVKALVGIAWQQ